MKRIIVSRFTKVRLEGITPEQVRKIFTDRRGWNKLVRKMCSLESRIKDRMAERRERFKNFYPKRIEKRKIGNGQDLLAIDRSVGCKMMRPTKRDSFYSDSL